MEGWVIISSTGFQILAIYFFQIVLKMLEMRSNRHKKSYILPKKITNLPSSWGLSHENPIGVLFE